MQLARQDSENDDVYAPYMERISEFPTESAGSSSSNLGYGLEDLEGFEHRQSAAFNMNFESSVSFPSKLYTCLIDAEEKGFADAISWQPDGFSFKVHKQDQFVKDILPVYFGAIKFKSWQRQLNLYGFTRVHKGLTRGSYTHDHFVRGRKSLSLDITRQKWSNNASSVIMPLDAQKDSESIIDFTPGNLPLNQGGILSWQPDERLKKNDFEVNYSGSSTKGPIWQNDILVDKGSLVSGPGPSMFEGGVNFGDQDALPLDMDNMSVQSSSSAVMPSAEELSFLLDFDERQMGKNGRTNSQKVSKRQPQANFFGDYGHLQAIANTLPAACDLMDDLSAGENPSQATSAVFPQAAASAPVATTAAATTDPRSFPWKLHEMLSEVDTNGFQDIISWEPDGMAFKVHDCRLFVEKVMPLYFDQSRYESFRRQLRKYGFARLNKDRYRGAYHHKNFQKANKSLCKFITRGNKGSSKCNTSKSKVIQRESINSSPAQEKMAV